MSGHYTGREEALLNAAKIGQGTRFFDPGCGAGGTAILAAQRGAHVSGLDASEALITIARERVPQGDFRVGDLEALPSPPTGGGPFALSAAGALESLVEQAGWKVIADNEVNRPFEYSDLEAHWQAQRSAGCSRRRFAVRRGVAEHDG